MTNNNWTAQQRRRNQTKGALIDSQPATAADTRFPSLDHFVQDDVMLMHYISHTRPRPRPLPLQTYTVNWTVESLLRRINNARVEHLIPPCCTSKTTTADGRTGHKHRASSNGIALEWAGAQSRVEI